MSAITVAADAGRAIRHLDEDEVEGLLDQCADLLDDTGASFAVVTSRGQAWVVGADGVRYGPVLIGLPQWHAAPALPRRPQLTLIAGGGGDTVTAGYSTCPACGGAGGRHDQSKGRLDWVPCTRCGGSGLVQS